MSHPKQAAKRKRRSKAVPVLGAAGLSLSLASGASAATGGPAADMLTRNSAASHEIILREEEISDVSLATFYVFDNENVRTVRPRPRLAAACGGCGGCGCQGCGGCGCWTGTNYNASVFGGGANPPHAIKPAHKHAHAHKRKHAPKSP